MSTEKRRRGFARLSPERRQQIARMGAKAVHEKGVAHRWDSEQAAAAGRKGGGSNAEGIASKKGRTDT